MSNLEQARHSCLFGLLIAHWHKPSQSPPLIAVIALCLFCKRRLCLRYQLNQRITETAKKPSSKLKAQLTFRRRKYGNTGLHPNTLRYGVKPPTTGEPFLTVLKITWRQIADCIFCKRFAKHSRPTFHFQFSQEKKSTS